MERDDKFIQELKMPLVKSYEEEKKEKLEREKRLLDRAKRQENREKEVKAMKAGVLAGTVVGAGILATATGTVKAIENKYDNYEKEEYNINLVEEYEYENKTTDERIQYISDKLQNSSELSDAELKDIAVRLSTLQKSVLKEQILDSLNANEVLISYSKREDHPNMLMIDGQRYFGPDLYNDIFDDSSKMDTTLNKYITSCNNFENLTEQKIPDANKCENILEEIVEIKNSNISIDENGNLVCEQKEQENIAEYDDEER